MENVLEVLMVVCFGISWPLNIRKLMKAKTAKGTSVMFYFFIWIGYLFGLGSKAIKAVHGVATPAYVWFFYSLNTVMVSIGILLYFYYKRQGRAGQGFESRNACLYANPEMASLCTGSTNFPTGIYANDMDLVVKLATMMKERGIKPEMEIFDTNMVGTAIELEKIGLVQKPLYFDFVMGSKNAQAADIRQLGYLVGMLPEDAQWCVSGIAANQVNTMLMAIGGGGHVRVGLEDNLYLYRGVKATNVQLVERVVRIAKEVGREIATPAQAREILGLPSE